MTVKAEQLRDSKPMDVNDEAGGAGRQERGTVEEMELRKELEARGQEIERLRAHLENLQRQLDARDAENARLVAENVRLRAELENSRRDVADPRRELDRDVQHPRRVADDNARTVTPVSVNIQYDIKNKAGGTVYTFLRQPLLDAGFVNYQRSCMTCSVLTAEAAIGVLQRSYDAFVRRYPQHPIVLHYQLDGGSRIAIERTVDAPIAPPAPTVAGRRARGRGSASGTVAQQPMPQWAL